MDGTFDVLDKITVLGEMPTRMAASKLRQLGDEQGAAELLKRSTPLPAGVEQPEGLFGWGEPKPYEHTTHQFGFIPMLAPGAQDA